MAVEVSFGSAAGADPLGSRERSGIIVNEERVDVWSQKRTGDL